MRDGPTKNRRGGGKREERVRETGRLPPGAGDVVTGTPSVVGRSWSGGRLPCLSQSSYSSSPPLGPWTRGLRPQLSHVPPSVDSPILVVPVAHVALLRQSRDFVEVVVVVVVAVGSPEPGDGRARGRPSPRLGRRRRPGAGTPSDPPVRRLLLSPFEPGHGGGTLVFPSYPDGPSTPTSVITGGSHTYPVNGESVVPPAPEEGRT